MSSARSRCKPLSKTSPEPNKFRANVGFPPPAGANPEKIQRTKIQKGSFPITIMYLAHADIRKIIVRIYTDLTGILLKASMLAQNLAGASSWCHRYLQRLTN